MLKQISGRDDEVGAEAAIMSRPRSRCCACAKPLATWARSPRASIAAAWKAASRRSRRPLRRIRKVPLKDAGILGAALRTEHYEIAGYSAALAMAKTLKESEIVKLLTETLKEEQAAAKSILSSAPTAVEAGRSPGRKRGRRGRGRRGKGSRGAEVRGGE